MCYTAVGLRLKLEKERNELVESAIMSALYGHLRKNSDGFSVMSRDDSAWKAVRSMDDGDARKEIRRVMENDFWAVHFRIATHGAKVVDNAHLWNIGKWYFSHNGTVHGENWSYYGNKDLEQKKADSLLFFEKLVEELNGKTGTQEVGQALSDLIEVEGVYGRGFLFDSEYNRIYGFGDLHAYLIDDNYLVLSSAETEFEAVDYKMIGDLFFTQVLTDTFEVLHSEIDRGSFWVMDLDSREVELLKIDKELSDFRAGKEKKTFLPAEGEQAIIDAGDGIIKNDDTRDIISVDDIDLSDIYRTAYRINKFMSAQFLKQAEQCKDKIEEMGEKIWS